MRFPQSLVVMLFVFPVSGYSFGINLNKYPVPKLALLKQHVIKDILSATVVLKQADSLANAMKPDGSWPDIDYADKTRGSWPVNDHLIRLDDMAIVYSKGSDNNTNKAFLQKQILLGLDYWLKNDFICPNWWYPQIGVPRAMAPVLLLMEDQLTPPQLAAGLKILDRAKIGMTGQNKVWLSGNVIFRSLLNGDTAAIEAAVKAIEGEIVVSNGEGIQPDFSFHQHGTQQQFGNYGSAYAGDMLKWAEIFEGTSYQFDQAKISILRNYLLEGMRWIIWKHKMDISACGRQLFPGAQQDKANSIQRIYSKMPLVDRANQSQYLSAMNDFSGNRHFWKSDMTVHRRNNFYVSVKMSSTRVGGAESCNEENVQGYHLGDGATYFYQSNNEYADIFPFWDWKMIPGTTCVHDAVPLPVLPCSGYNIPSDFVGGVSDGNNGIATLAYTRDSLTAQKSWFFFDDAIICVGAGISTPRDSEVRTTINQSFLHGSVTVHQAGKAADIAPGVHHLEKVKWLTHDNWAYYFPSSGSIELSNRPQEGDWHNVLRRMPSSKINASLFTLWINHGAKPRDASYAYYVFPSANARSIEATANTISVTSNTSLLQVIENSKTHTSGMVFVQPGQASTKNFGIIAADHGCVIMIGKKYAATQMDIADPTHQLTSLRITVPGRRSCAMATAAFQADKNTTTFDVPLPQGADAGKTVHLTITG